MNFDWSKEQVEQYERISTAAKNLNSADPEIWDRKPWEQTAKLGATGCTIPKEFGGMGLDPISGAFVMEAFGYGCRNNGLVLSLGAHLGAVATPIAIFGTNEQRSKWFPGLCEGRSIGCFAATESEAGSDLFALKTTAEKGDGYRLNGKKAFVTNSQVADVAIVLARTDENKKSFLGGLTAFLVDLKASGITRASAQMMGLRSASVGEISFENVSLSEKDILGHAGAGAEVLNCAMNWERVLIFAALCGTMQRLFETTLARSKKRQQFQQPIGKFQALQHRIADLRVRLEASKLLTYKAAAVLSKARGICIEASMAKLAVSENLVQTALEALQIHGAFGYTEESGIGRELRDALASPIYSGTSEIQRTLIAKDLGL